MNAIKTRGRTFRGIVTSDKMTRTVTVSWERRHYIPKYERYSKRKTVVKAHNPDEIDAKVGDTVIIKETRPLSKTKNFIVIKKLTAEEAKQEASDIITDAVKEDDAEEAQPAEEKKAAPVKKAAKKATKKTTKKVTKKAAKKTSKKSE